MGFRWACPYYGTSRLDRSEDAAGEANAIAALRTHILTSDGAGPGPKNEYPADLAPGTLAEHVVGVDGRR